MEKTCNPLLQFFGGKNDSPSSLSHNFFLYSLHTGNISVYKFYSKKVIYTFCNKNYHHKYWLQNCRILVCPTVVTESFSSMETVVFMLNHWRIIWTHCNRFYRKKGCSDDDMPVMKFLKRWSCFVMNLIFFVVIRGQSTRSFMYIESKPWWKEECQCISIMNMVSNFLYFTI